MKQIIWRKPGEKVRGCHARGTHHRTFSVVAPRTGEPTAVRRNETRLALALACVDVVASLDALAVAVGIAGIDPTSPASLSLALVALLGVLFGIRSGLYSPHRFRQDRFQVAHVVASSVKGSVVGTAFLAFVGHHHVLLSALLLFSLLSMLARVAGRGTVGALSPALGIDTSVRLLIVGGGDIAMRLAASTIKSDNSRVELIGFVDDAASGELLGLPVFPGTSLESVVAHFQINHVVVAFSRTRDSELVRRLRSLKANNVLVTAVPRLFEVPWRGTRVTSIRDIPLVELGGATAHTLQLRLKRAFDVVAVLAGLPIVLTVMICAIAAMLLSGQRQIIYRQQRIGRGGKRFTMYKLCSMRPPRLGEDPHDPARYTRVGAILRSTSIDELPQLWNVLRGEMSLVGPRPEFADYALQFNERIPGYERRLLMLGGLTGLSQISGLRGDTSIVERSKLDNYYVDNWSFMLDLKILVGTIARLMPKSHGIGGETAFLDVVAEVSLELSQDDFLADSAGF